MFHGPPPPIASSIMAGGRSNGQSPTWTDGNRSSRGLVASSRSRLGELWSDQRRDKSRSSQDSVWRGLRRRERALEQDIQQLLDLQATGLVAGSTVGSDIDGHSDAGSSTPTGTFYSTATSKSRMMNSLHIPTKSTPEGNVIPVRQPKASRPLGLRSARAGLRKTMSALGDLKREEDAHVDAALSERKRALVHLNKVNKRVVSVRAELQSFEGSVEEPLGIELRTLGGKYDEVSQEIRELEEKLVAKRNHRRSLRERIEDVKSQREAGLSGYRGALKDADTELTSIMRHPPIQPIDADMLLRNGTEQLGEDAPSGVEFLRLLPERRTADMAKTWWESEINALEHRRIEIAKEKQALEEGSAVWNQVTSLVTNFEASLRQLMKGSAVEASVKGKEKVSSQEGLIRNQLPHMQEVVVELDKHLAHAEDKGWNLLICAIGAEVEAFREAFDMLKGLAGQDDEVSQEPSQNCEVQENRQGGPGTQASGHESDNEVPADLLVSKVAEGDSQDTGTSQDVSQEHDVKELKDHEVQEPSSELARQDSVDEVPPEFLAEHE